MSIAQLPIQVDPRRLAEQNVILEGEVTVAELERLADRLFDNAGTVWAKFDFGRDPGGCNTINAHIKAKLVLQCQRCMQPMAYTVDTHFVLSPIAKEEEADNLAADYEPLPLPAGDLVSLLVLIEDELLLSVPIVPKHDTAACKVKLADVNQADDAEERVEEKPNPFAVLKQLKKK